MTLSTRSPHVGESDSVDAADVMPGAHDNPPSARWTARFQEVKHAPV